METYTYHFGGMMNRLAEELGLPILNHRGAIVHCRQALDLCAGSRVGTAVIGPKGSGKTIGLQVSYNWFMEAERERKRRDNSYAVRRILRLRAIRCRSDRDVIMVIARQLAPTYSDRAKGRRKTVQEIRTDVIELCRRQQYALITVDEADTYADSALECLRDLLTESGEDGTGKVTGDIVNPKGIGLLFIGLDGLSSRLGFMEEAGERWRQVIDVAPLDVPGAVEAYTAWFPGFSEHIDQVGPTAWSNYIASVICRGNTSVSFRFLENQARLYTHMLVRTHPNIMTRETVPFDKNLFEYAARECSWADRVAPPPQAQPRPRSRSKRRKGALDA
jgi:type II secretory pathway predicted ATPase ExeA